MLPVGQRDCAPQIIHQHTHIHNHKHVHRVRHVHHKAARFYADGFDNEVRRGRSGQRRTSNELPRLRSPSPLPTTWKGKLYRFARKRIYPIIAFLCEVAIFVASRISFGFGFRVSHLPFFGDNLD